METKICTKCGLEKPLDDFGFRNKTKGIRRSDCKQCHSQYSKNKYYENKSILNNIKIQGKCEKCGYDKCVSALEYHHKEPENKINGISVLATHYNLQIGLEEISKCVLLCANCHREFHYLEQNIKGFLLKDFLNINFEKEDFSKFIEILKENELKEKVKKISAKEKNSIIINYCVDCGKEILKNSIRCRRCENIHRKTEVPITREELKNLIRNKPFTQIGKELNISDNGVRQWCIKYNLPKTKKEIKNYTNEEWNNI